MLGLFGFVTFNSSGRAPRRSQTNAGGCGATQASFGRNGACISRHLAARLLQPRCAEHRPREKPWDKTHVHEEVAAVSRKIAMGGEVINTHKGNPLATYPEHCYIGGTTIVSARCRLPPSPSLTAPRPYFVAKIDDASTVLRRHDDAARQR